MKRILTFVLLFTVLMLTSCGVGAEFGNETAAMRSFLQGVDTEKEIEILVLDKYSTDKNEVYYYVRWEYEGDVEESELLIVYNTKEKSAEIVTFEDMNGEENVEIKAKWDELKYARADRMFSPTEIEQIISEAKG